MGELIRREAASAPLPFSGERLTSAVPGYQVDIEHYHRYLLARDYCRDRDILDVASGEGYGTALLAQVARSVIGIEIDPAVVEAARTEFGRENLRYEQGDARALPLPDASVDVVVSFETLEHIFEQDVFLGELRRVLRPGGLVVMSTPDRDVYSAAGVPPNPYHLLELTRTEFEALLQRHFSHAAFTAQRAVIGSVAVGASSGIAPRVFEWRSNTYFEANDHLPRAPYIIALASDSALPPLRDSIYVYRGDLDTESAVRARVEELLRVVEAEKTTAKAEIARAHGERDQAEVAKVQAEAARGQAEAAKAQAEAGRDRAEAAKAEAEAGRGQAEAARAQAQEERDRAEASRARAETEQTLAEQRIAELERQMAAAESDSAAREWAHQVAFSQKEKEIANLEERVGRSDECLESVLRSTSWRLTAPLRYVGALSPTFARYGRRCLKLAWWTVTLQLPGRVAARLRAHHPQTTEAVQAALPTAPGVASLENEETPVFPPSPIATPEGMPGAASLENEETPAFATSPIATPEGMPGFASLERWTGPAFTLSSIATPEGPIRLRCGNKGWLICVTHVLPYPSRAGNEYRIHRMLESLADQGWEVLLVVCPLPNEQVTSRQLSEAAGMYPNLIVCHRDGTLAYNLSDCGAMLKGLTGRQPRMFGPLLGEAEEASVSVLQLRDVMRVFCPDLLIELLLHLESELNPEVLLAEYVFMTRPFALLRPGLLKVVDTIDVFSTKHAKVVQYGIEDSLALVPELEAGLLNHADLLIAIHDEEADELRRLAPERPIISVGVDFTVLDRAPPRATRPILLLVSSANAMNVKGLRDFLRFSWPLIRKSVQDAELHIVGAVGESIGPVPSGVQILGQVHDLTAAYESARVVINPAVAGTGLKIKTIEALCHLRPIVVWPSGMDGLAPKIGALCHLATDWFEFSQHVIRLANMYEPAQALIDRRSELAGIFSAENVYRPLEAALAAGLPERAFALSKADP